MADALTDHDEFQIKKNVTEAVRAHAKPGPLKTIDIEQLKKIFIANGDMVCRKTMDAICDLVNLNIAESLARVPKLYSHKQDNGEYIWSQVLSKESEFVMHQYIVQKYEHHDPVTIRELIDFLNDDDAFKRRVDLRERVQRYGIVPQVLT